MKERKTWRLQAAGRFLVGEQESVLAVPYDDDEWAMARTWWE